MSVGFLPGMVILRFGLTLFAAVIGADELVPVNDKVLGMASAPASGPKPGTSTTGQATGGEARTLPPAAVAGRGSSRPALAKVTPVKLDRAAAFSAAVVQ